MRSRRSFPRAASSCTFGIHPKREAAVHRNQVILSLSLLLLTACASTMVPRANTRDAIVTYVDAAAKVVAKSGPACETFSSPKWTAGDYYIFVIGPDNRIVCHLSAAEIGRPTSSLADFDGRAIGDAFVAAAARPEGHGWVDYMWPRPGMKTPSAKSAFVRSVTGPDGKRYIVGGGGYGL